LGRRQGRSGLGIRSAPAFSKPDGVSLTAQYGVTITDRVIRLAERKSPFRVISQRFLNGTIGEP
jgi:hypothetical protein